MVYFTTKREGYREYKSREYLCKTYPTRRMCTENAKCEKTVLRHVWQDYVEMAEHVRYIPVYKELYRLRKEKIERVFADAKEKHGMRYKQYRGLAQVTNWVKLKFVAINLKKLAVWKWSARHPGRMAVCGPKHPKMHPFFAAFSDFPFVCKENLLWPPVICSLYERQ